MLNKRLPVSAALLLAASLHHLANAGTFVLNFTGPGVSGSVNVTYGTVKDATYQGAYEVTGISGTFSDSNNGLNIVNVPIGPLIAITHDTPEATNLLAPHDFSKFAVASGLDPVSNGFLTYDNLYYPGGSPQTASDYPLHGGVLDIYGLFFSIGGGRVVDLWSNGAPTPISSGPIDYGVAVATSAAALDYVGQDVVVTPEPNALALLGGGLCGLLAWRRTTRHNSH